MNKTNKINKINKRGDVPTILLFVVAIVLAVVALFSFLTFNTNFEGKSKEFSNMMSEIEFKQAYIERQAEFVGNQVVADSGSKLEFASKMREKNIGLSGTEGFFEIIESGNYKFEKIEGKWSLEINDIVIKAQRGKNFIIREFDIKKEFVIVSS